MSNLPSLVAEFLGLCARGTTVEAIARFYAPEVVIFENRELVRAGQGRCLDHERDWLLTQPTPPRVQVRNTAINEAAGIAFIDWVLRFHSADGRPLRLDEVVIQTWEQGRVTQSRSVFEGVVDEGDCDGPLETLA